MLQPVTLHADEVAVDEATVRELLRSQYPDLAGETVTSVGGGTDNTVFRVGADHLARLPRTRGHVAALAKELTWLPRLAPHLSHPVPSPVFAGRPDQAHPLSWAICTWLDGDEPSSRTVVDWARYGHDLADFTTSLHRADLQGATRSGDLDWYRGHGLAPQAEQVRASFVDARRHAATLDVDLDHLHELWRRALSLPDPEGSHVWLHADLRPSNLLVRDGLLRAVLDFGTLSVGHPDAEHALAWDLPPEGRRAYRESLDIDEPTWTRATGWAIAFGVGGLSSYWGRLPTLVAECVQRLRHIAAAAD